MAGVLSAASTVAIAAGAKSSSPLAAEAVDEVEGKGSWRLDHTPGEIASVDDSRV